MQYHRRKNRRLRHMLAAPVIYSIIVGLVILDVFMEVYHRICFPLYGLPRVKRSNYIRVDRQKLSYLSWYEKINCMYCGYANGLAQYAVRIAADTERYWCGIKHQQGGGFNEPAHHKDFLSYGDKQAFQNFISKK